MAHAVLLELHIAAYLTEIILLGCVALPSRGPRMEWMDEHEVHQFTGSRPIRPPQQCKGWEA